MATVTIGSDTYTVYRDVAAVDTYAAARIGSASTAWLAATSGLRAQACVTATRIMERMLWAGDVTVSGQALAWPRSGLVDRNGVDVDESTTPDDVLNGFCELCFALVVDADTVIDNAAGTASNIAELNAKGVSIRYWSPTTGTRLPTATQEWFSFWIDGGDADPTASGDVSGLGGVATGTDVCSSFAGRRNHYDQDL